MQPDTNGHRRDPDVTPSRSVASGAIRGGIRGRAGRVVTGATVTVIDPSGRQAARSIAHQDGTFVAHVPAGDHYVLVVSAAGHEPSAVPVTVGTTPIDVDVVLTSLAALTGTVLTTTGEAVGAATVAIADHTGEVTATAITDAAGRWEAAGVTTGTYTVIVTAAGCDPVAETATVRGTTGTTVDVVLHTAADLGGVVFDGVGTDRGAGPGTAVAHSQVALLNDDGEMAASTLTDESGRYLFANLAAGDYTVIANGYAPVADSIIIEAGRVVTHDFVLGARGQA
ncbi:MSCRAMM family protein [Gordonia soli]|uniref:Uncharacterized protein n=1 Tax=Gordonia soli NBRC 108243 TaxID=1223545 RepID=M0QGT7_9ACTN|nr:carboxypeptidase-like regulatory domain-containing protein [Gordonia soli]GAC67511.1 hypothetical protein GS4_08_00960 [Gordonia soli NBRC 108243]